MNRVKVFQPVELSNVGVLDLEGVGLVRLQDSGANCTYHISHPGY